MHIRFLVGALLVVGFVVGGVLLAPSSVHPSIGSLLAPTFAMPGTVGLAAVNGALEAATRTLAKEIAPRRVNLVSPGLTHCPKNSARRCSPTLPRGCP
jgi:NAD(P)-dependent dehydrogenase (short-subunit alcohol dehydrogenase family)